MKKKIRVLHVAEAAGGVERYLENLFKYNNNEQIENILVCSQNYEWKKFEAITNRVIVLKMAHNIDPIKDAKVEKALRKIIRRTKPDIIYSHSSKAGAFARIAAIGMNVKSIYNPHGWAFNTQPSLKKRKIYKLAERFLSPLCTKIVCTSDAEKNSAIDAKICKSSKLEVIYSGVDLKNINDVVPVSREKLNIPNDAFVIGMVGRLTKLKSPDVFISAAKKISLQIPNAFFLMVGDGELRKEVEELIQENELESKFIITGWTDNPISFVKIMDIGMLLSRWWEGFGLVTTEYMACSVPVIATNVGAIPNIVHNQKNGLLVNSDNSDSVADDVILLYNNESLRRKIIMNAYKDVKKNYDIRRVAVDTINLYKKIM